MTFSAYIERWLLEMHSPVQSASAANPCYVARIVAQSSQGDLEGTPLWNPPSLDHTEPMLRTYSPRVGPKGKNLT